MRTVFPDVRHRNLNIELLAILLTLKECNEFYQRIISKIKNMDRTSVPSFAVSRKKYHALVNAVESNSCIVDKVETAPNTVRSEGFYDAERYMESVYIVNESLEYIPALYYLFINDVSQ